jgi:hypothetical protein
MPTTKTPKDVGLSPFERFVKAIFQVPKVAIYEAEARRVKRTSPKPAKPNGGD